MHFASYGGSIKVANELLRLGADARAADKVSSRSWVEAAHAGVTIM